MLCFVSDNIEPDFFRKVKDKRPSAGSTTGQILPVISDKSSHVTQVQGSRQDQIGNYYLAWESNNTVWELREKDSLSACKKLRHFLPHPSRFNSNSHKLVILFASYCGSCRWFGARDTVFVVCPLVLAATRSSSLAYCCVIMRREARVGVRNITSCYLLEKLLR